MLPEARFDHIDDHVRARLADMLGFMSKEIEDLGETLCSTVPSIEPLMVSLQAIDLISQQQKAIASILVSNDVHRSIDAITLESVKSFVSNRP